jgi:hypothetical protein
MHRSALDLQCLTIAGTTGMRRLGAAHEALVHNGAPMAAQDPHASSKHMIPRRLKTGIRIAIKIDEGTGQQPARGFQPHPLAISGALTSARFFCVTASLTCSGRHVLTAARC